MYHLSFLCWIIPTVHINVVHYLTLITFSQKKYSITHLYTAVCNYMVTTFFCCSTIFSAILLSECLSSDLFRNLLEEKKKSKSPHFLELKHWNNTSGGTRKQFSELLTSHSSISPQPLWARHCGEHTPLSARMPALISAPSPSHRPLLCSHFKLPGWPPVTESTSDSIKIHTVWKYVGCLSGTVQIPHSYLVQLCRQQ